MESRKEDTSKAKKVHYRTDRFFEEGEHWFFATREGTLEGPYDTKRMAQKALALYIAEIELSKQFEASGGYTQVGDNKDKHRFVEESPGAEDEVWQMGVYDR